MPIMLDRESKQETQRMIVEDDFGRKLKVEAPTPGHFCGVSRMFREAYPGYTGPLKVTEVGGDYDGQVSIIQDFGKLSRDEFKNLVVLGITPINRG